MPSKAQPSQTMTSPSGSTYTLIRDAVLDGTYEPGAPLVELVLAKQYGVSRTPIREALTRLEQDGLVVRGARGLVVRERSPEEILDIYEARLVLEAAVVEAAAKRHTQLDRVRIENAVRGCEAATGHPEKMVAANDAFHRAIWLSSHNEAFIGLLEQLRLHLVRYPGTTISYPGRWEESLEEHRQITKAIVDRDSDAASRLAREHFEHARDVRVKLWENELS
ncbi:GntR family transcriptional regulator [Gryllotalpicola protaetiae]|uniref:GntR family transcriptional regulator n=2 Tax=Gryllotalpicola protaetiae TaxID=2419771 RepID=A0A387BPW0_9MICO|nr:GntR family transcriptional regulator [Gryllotalpicola protaetiae]